MVARDLLSIDIAVVTEGRFIAIEVDGPFHFPVNARTPLGHTMIRRRLLRAAGWTVVPIPWYEWFEMKTWDERLQYLASALSKADETLLGQLRPAVRELLSTEFLPGPGVPGVQKLDVKFGQSSQKGADVEDGEDGPVLTYSDTLYGLQSDSSAIETGLMDALNRSNVQLTSGAVRRLKSMGLEEKVKDIASRRRKEKHTEVQTNGYNNTGNSQKENIQQRENTSSPGTISKTGKGQPVTRFNPKFVDSDAGWSPYWNASFVSSSEEEIEEGLSDDCQQSEAVRNKSDKLFKKVLHGRDSATRPHDPTPNTEK